MYCIQVLSSERVITAATWEAAVGWLRERYPNAEIGHDGDMEDGGDCTMCWMQTEEQAAAGEGEGTAIASITRSYDDD